MTLTSEQLQALRAKAEAATPGPWRAGAVEKERIFVDTPKGDWLGHERVLLRMNVHFDNYAVDAAFIASASPDVIIALLDQLDAVARARDEACRIAQYVAVLHGSTNDVDMTPTKDRIRELEKAGTP